MTLEELNAKVIDIDKDVEDLTDALSTLMAHTVSLADHLMRIQGQLNALTIKVNELTQEIE